jgi:hypothetical protein
MFGRLRHWAIAGAALSGLAMGVMATPGYLPVIGPVALRFRVAAPPATNLTEVNLPPPEPEPPAAVVAATNPPPAPVPVALAPKTNAPVVLTTPEPAGSPTASDPMVSPQMLLKFFNRGTNGPANSVIAPMEFAPPGVAKPPASSATYTTSPPP